MSMVIVLVGGTFIFFVLLIGYIIYYEEINQTVKDFFENRNVRKIAKKLGLVDKGLMPLRLVKAPHSEDGWEKLQVVHDFCKKRGRLGLLGGKPVKWCPSCEKIYSEEDDLVGGGKDHPDHTPPPDPSELTRDAIEKAKKPRVPSL